MTRREHTICVWKSKYGGMDVSEAEERAAEKAGGRPSLGLSFAQERTMNYLIPMPELDGKLSVAVFAIDYQT